MASDHRQRKCCYQQQQGDKQQQQQGSSSEFDGGAEMMMTTKKKVPKNAGDGGGVNGGVEESVWKACAGTLVRIPAVNSRAYYFPQGHMEQSSPSALFSSLPAQVTSRPSIPCRVLQVTHQADRVTDEVFAKIQLLAVTGDGNAGGGGSGGIEEEGGNGGVISFAKVLTPSDANNGGGFSVPRFCADSIFPELDFKADPPVQNILITDVHGETWEFRHIYRGTPRRHLLTTGWSKFVNSKKLIAGDSVVFIKNTNTGQLYVGVRRANKAFGGGGNAANYGGGWASSGAGYMRSGGGVISEKEKAVVDAVERAVSGMVFEVVYYPRPGVPEFVVPAERVEAAMSVYWSAGMRVKMATETEDSSRLQWFQGIVRSVSVSDSGVFARSTWRMLEVEWDEGDVLKNMRRVSPWQVEFVPPTPPIHTAFPPNKKFRCTNPGMLTDGEGEFPLPNVPFSSMMGQLSPSYLNYNSFPAGMQGARQSYSSLPNSIVIEGPRHSHNMSQKKNTDNMSHQKADTHTMSQKMDTLSTDLNIGNTSSDTASPDSQNSVQLFNTTTIKQQSQNSTRKAGITSFQLFGKTIHTEKPLTNADKTEESESSAKGGENKGAENTINHSLVDPYKKLHDRLGSETSAVEAIVKG